MLRHRPIASPAHNELIRAATIEPRHGARMRRRELPLVLMAGMMGHRAARAQQKAMPVIGL